MSYADGYRDTILKAINLGGDTDTIAAIAGEIGCSVHPIFRIFNNMDELKEEIFAAIAKDYQEYLVQSMTGDDPLQNLLLAYIRYAQKEKEFFKLLHMSDRLGLQEIGGFSDVGVNKVIVEEMAKETGLSIRGARMLYIGTFFATHGVAAMLATNHCNFSGEEIGGLIRAVYEGMKSKLKTDDGKGDGYER